MLDEMERSIHDAICVVKRVLESKTVVPGGGAVEAALSIYLENFATSLVRIPWKSRTHIHRCQKYFNCTYPIQSQQDRKKSLSVEQLLSS